MKRDSGKGKPRMGKNKKMSPLPGTVNQELRKMENDIGKKNKILWKNETTNKTNKGFLSYFDNRPIGTEVDFKNDKVKYMNFAQVPYYQQSENQDVITDINILKKIKESTGNDPYANLKSVFDNFTLSEKHLQVLKSFYEKDELEAFETYLALILYNNPDSAYIRDMIYDMFPEVYEKRENYYRNNIDFYNKMAKLALRGPQDASDIMTAYYLSLGSPGKPNPKDEDYNDDRNKKVDEGIVQEFLFRNKTRLRPINSDSNEPDKSDLPNVNDIPLQENMWRIMNSKELAKNNNSAMANVNDDYWLGDVPKKHFTAQYTPKLKNDYHRKQGDIQRQMMNAKTTSYEKKMFKNHKTGQDNKNDLSNMLFNKFI